MPDDSLRRRGFYTLALWALYATLVVAKSLWVLDFAWSPICYFDELLYKEIAVSLVSGTPPPTAHYPFGYPFVIAPGMLVEERWYEATILINVLISSLLLFPAWGVARIYLRERLAFCAVLGVAFLPFHLIYPPMIMSENLFLPLFLTAAYIALRIEDSRRPVDLAFGFLCGLAYVTKFLFLATLPALGLVRWLFANEHDSLRPWKARSLLRLGAMVGAFLLPLAVWLSYVSPIATNAAEYLGFASSPLTAQTPPLWDLGLWLCAYLSYLVLATSSILVGFVGVLVMGRTEGVRIPRKEKALFVLTTGSTALLVLLATKHSWGASYNYPQPLFLIGRYLMPLIPLWFILGAVCLVRLNQISDRSRTLAKAVMAMGIAVAVVAAACYGAWSMLFTQRFWAVPAWFAAVAFNSPDTLLFRYDARVAAVVVAVATLVSASCVVASARGRHVAHWLLICSLLMPCVLGALTGQKFVNTRSMDNGSIDFALVRFVRTIAAHREQPARILVDFDRPSVRRLQQSLRFWEVEDIPIERLGDAPIQSYQGEQQQNYLMTAKRLDAAPVARISVGDDQFSFYDLKTITLPVGE